MPSALTPKQENFCQAYVETSNASEAYRRSYNASNMSDKSVWEKASVTLAKVKVRARIEEILAERERRMHERFEVTKERILAEYAKIGFADIRKTVRWRGELITEEDNPDGGDTLVIRNIHSNHVELISSDDLDEDTAAAIAEVSQSPTGGLKVKFHDKKAALDSMAKHLGMFPAAQLNGKIEHDHKHHHSVEPLSESAQWLAKLLGGKADSETEGALLH